MKCPLLGTVRTEGEINPERADCLREKCAWWLDSRKGCAVLLVAIQLASIAATGDDINKKMPSKVHFGK
ncbi:hypothetical protein ES704_01973 [subsurface metagenome]|jgi:hypothetical protein